MNILAVILGLDPRIHATVGGFDSAWILVSSTSMTGLKLRETYT